jgi:DNA-binding MarR family transcriptional regulator
MRTTTTEIAGEHVRAMEHLLAEVRLTSHEAAALADRLHAAESVTAGMRAVLEWLAHHGPAPVLRIARERSVSGQHIQTLVNALQERGLVAADANPDHRRSVLIRLTDTGVRTIRRMLRRERRYLATLRPPVGDEEVLGAARVLAALREWMSGAVA